MMLTSEALSRRCFARSVSKRRRSAPPPSFCPAISPTCRAALFSTCSLPGVSGIEFQAELAKANIGLPIIFITGHGDIPMTVRAMKAGAIEFLTKPVREQEFA